jgi:hypothetical protein
MHGPICIFWANLTLYSLQGRPLRDRGDAERARLQRELTRVHQLFYRRAYSMNCVRTASRDKDATLAQKLGQLQPFLAECFHRNAWANLHLLGQPNTSLTPATDALRRDDLPTLHHRRQGLFRLLRALLPRLPPANQGPVPR